MRVTKEAGVLLISGLPKLTQGLCLLSWQTFQHTAVTLSRGQGPCSGNSGVRREPRAGSGLCQGRAEPAQPSALPRLCCAHALGGKQGFTLQRRPVGYSTRMGRKSEQRTENLTQEVVKSLTAVLWAGPKALQISFLGEVFLPFPLSVFSHFLCCSFPLHKLLILILSFIYCQLAHYGRNPILKCHSVFCIHNL